MSKPSVWPALSREGGQGMTEYIIIVVLIAIAAIGVYSFFGQNARQPAPVTAQDPSGKAGTKESAAAQPVQAEQAGKSDTKGAGDAKSAVK